VLCQGRVIRSADLQSKKSKNQDQDAAAGAGLLAASIVDYKFIR